MADGIVAGAGSFVEEHPYATAAIAVVGVVLIWYMFSGSSSGSTAGSGPTDTSGAAAAVQAAQTAANEATAQSTIAAGVTNNQTAAAQTVALAQIQGNVAAANAAASAATATAYYGAAGEVATANSNTAIAAITAGAQEQLSNNNLLKSEFSNLASVLATFGESSQQTAQILEENRTQVTTAALPYVSPTQAYGLVSQAQGANVTTSQSGTSASQSASASASGLGSFFPWLFGLFSGGSNAGGASASGVTALQSSYTPSANPNFVAANSANLAGFGALLSAFGRGAQAPSAPSLSQTGLLSLASINNSAVTNSFTNSH